MSTVQQQGLLVRNLWYAPHERTLKFSENLEHTGTNLFNSQRN